MNARHQHILVVEQALCIIAAEWGKHFDPDVVDALVEIEDTFRDIARRFDDGNGRDVT